MVITRTVEMHAQLVGYDFKKKGLPTDKNIAVENSKVSNDYFWKTNKYTDQDVFGRTLDLTALINKPDGYLKGSLSDTEDVDYYEFNITEYRALSFVKDTYNRDITITLDHIPEGCDYEMVLYDEEGNQVGIGKENGNGGLSITIPNWNSDNTGYTVKVQAKNGSTVNPDAEYHLSFQTTQADKSHGAYQEMAEVQKYDGECSTPYPGKIKAASDVQLAFRVAGPILRFNAEVGEFVKKGEVLAEIDPRDYRLQYEATKAEYTQVTEESDRVIELYHRKSVPVNDYDKAVAAKQRIASLYHANLIALNDTKLKAPFDGYVQK